MSYAYIPYNIRAIASTLVTLPIFVAAFCWVAFTTGRKTNAQSPKKQKKHPSAIDRWTQARKHQEDSEHIHSAGVDTCEARLENVRHLYEAGLLDEDEYRLRVARIREKHNA